MYETKLETKSAPEKKFSTGAINATIWQNQGKDKNGQTVPYRTVSLQRRYKDPKGVWQSASSLRVNDLPRASLVLQKAFEYLVIREKENQVHEDIYEEVVEEVN